MLIRSVRLALPLLLLLLLPHKPLPWPPSLLDSPCARAESQFRSGQREFANAGSADLAAAEAAATPLTNDQHANVDRY